MTPIKNSALVVAALLLAAFDPLLRAGALDPWEWRSPLPQPHTLRAVAYGNGLFVAVGAAGAVVTSTNGLDWKAGHSGMTGNLVDVAFGNGRFVAVGNSGLVGQSVVLTSPDGATWNRRDFGPGGYLYSVVYGAGRFLIPSGMLAPSKIVTSTDGIVWTTNTLTGTTAIRNPKYFDGLFVALSGSSLVETSIDGLDWTVHPTSPLAPLGQAGSPAGVAYADGSYVVVGDLEERNSDDDEPTFHAYSTDLVNWETQRDLVISLTDVSFCGANFIAVGPGGVLMISPPMYHGRVWNGVSPRPVSQDLNGSAYGAGVYVAVGGDGAIVSSIEDGPWIRRNTPLGSVNLRCLVYSAGQFVAAGNNGLLKTSPDGTTWTNVASRVTRNLRGLAQGNGTFVAVGEKGTVVTSSDGGKVWTNQPLAAKLELYSVCFATDRFVAVGDDNTNGVSLTSLNGTNWTDARFAGPSTLHSVVHAQGQFVAVGNGGLIATSSDGQEWIPRNSGTTRSLQGIAWGKGRFVAAGDGGIVLTSPDSVNWTSQTNAIPDAFWQKVAFANGLFVLVGDLGKVASSPDGVAWTEHLSGSPFDIRDVAFGNGRFVVVGHNETIMQSASMAWLSGRLQTNNGGLALSFSGEAGRGYRIESSSNLVTWDEFRSFTAGAPQTNFVDATVSPPRFYRVTAP